MGELRPHFLHRPRLGWTSCPLRRFPRDYTGRSGRHGHVIQLTLIVLRQSTTSLRGLWNEALPAVINELETAGYIVDQKDRAERTTGWLHKYAIEPGPATLLAAANTHESGDITFNLKGKKYGQNMQYHDDYDEALWDRLEALRIKLTTAHQLLTTLSDPDFVLGGPGAPGTYLPDLDPPVYDDK